MIRNYPTSSKYALSAVRFGKRETITVLIIAAAMLATPAWLHWREQPMASESHQYLAAVQSAQARFHAIHNQYAKHICDLDMTRPEPTFFAVGEVMPGSTGSLEDSWSLTLTRFGNSLLFGRYTVTFNEIGFDERRSTIDENLVDGPAVEPRTSELASR